MNKQRLIAFVILICLVLLCSQSVAKKLYIDYLGNIEQDRILRLGVNNSQISYVIWDTSNKPFILGLNEDTEYIVKELNEDNIRDFINVLNPDKIDLLEDISTIKLTTNIPSKNKYYCPLTFKSEVEIDLGEKVETAVASFDYNEGKLNLIDVNLKKIIEITNYQQFENLLQTVKLKEKTGNKLHPIRDGIFWLNEINYDDTYILVSDVCQLPLDTEQLLTNFQIEIPTKVFTLNLDNTSDLASFSIVASDKTKSKEVTLATLKDVDDNNKVKIADMEYPNLLCNYIFKDSPNSSREISLDMEQSEIDITKGSRYVKIPKAYADINFTIKYWDDKNTKFQNYYYTAYDDSIDIYEKLQDNRAIYYENTETGSLKKITLNNDTNKPEIIIHEKSPFVVIDLNHTHKIVNKKDDHKFVSFLNSLLTLTNNENAFFYKFFNIGPYDQNTFNNYRIEKIRIRDDAELDFSEFSQKSITKNGLNNFKKYVDKNNISLVQNQIFDNFYILEPFTRDHVTNIKTTDNREDINDYKYRNDVVKMLTSFLQKKGVDYSDILYITYYPFVDKKNTNQIKFYSFQNESKEITNMIESLAN